MVAARTEIWEILLRQCSPARLRKILELVKQDPRTRAEAPAVDGALGPLRRRRPRDQDFVAAAAKLASVDSPCAIADEIATAIGTDDQLAEARSALQEAMHCMVHSNLRLVVSQVQRRSRGYTSREWDDAISDGNLGLLRAVELFDPSRGLRFSTYAVHWIRHMLHRGVQNFGRTVRLPAHAITKASKISRAEATLRCKLGREPTDAEVAAASEIQEDKLARFRSALAQRMVALDEPAGNGYVTIADTLVADQPDPEEASSADELRTLLEEGLADLRDRRLEYIVRSRFGLDDAPRTLQEIADELGLSRERVRQLQNDALASLAAQIRRSSTPRRLGAPRP